MSDPKQARREQWEKECVRELRARISRLRGIRGEQEVEEIVLDGSFPDTKIVIRYTLRHTGRKTTDAYELWGPLFLDRGGRESPDQVAMLIHTWISGG